MSEAYSQISATRDIPVFIFGDHASRHIPGDFDNLGLIGDDLTRHIAWDIGTDVLVRDLAVHFGCGAQIAGVSRLVIDLNRDTRMTSSIPVESDGTLIPGNRGVTPEDRQARIDRFHVPYHAALARSIDALDDPLIISVHSFTPKPDLGDVREVDIGLLVKHDEPSAFAFQAEIARRFPNYRVGINEPYSAHILNYTIDTAVAAKQLRHLAIEVNQALIDTPKKASDMAKQLAVCLEPILTPDAAPKEVSYAG